MHGGSDAGGGGLPNPYLPLFSAATSNGVFSSAAPASAAAAATAAPAVHPSPQDLVRRKRGRPRKYGAPSPSLQPHPAPAKLALSSKSPLTSPGSSPLPRKKEGSSSKKAQLAALGNVGQGFTPHVITIAQGENVTQRVLSFMQECKWTVCILSAFGSISYASLCQPATLGGSATYEGMFEIISLSGSLLQNDAGGVLRTGKLCVCLSGADGRFVGGEVGGPLIAGTTVEVIAASFYVDSVRTVKISQEMADDSAEKLSLSFLSGGAVTPVTLPLTSGSSGSVVNIRDSNDRQRFSEMGRDYMLHSQTMPGVQSNSSSWRGGRDGLYSTLSQQLPTDDDDEDDYDEDA